MTPTSDILTISALYQYWFSRIFILHIPLQYFRMASCLVVYPTFPSSLGAFLLFFPKYRGVHGVPRKASFWSWFTIVNYFICAFKGYLKHNRIYLVKQRRYVSHCFVFDFPPLPANQWHSFRPGSYQASTCIVPIFNPRIRVIFLSIVRDYFSYDFMLSTHTIQYVKPTPAYNFSMAPSPFQWQTSSNFIHFNCSWCPLGAW